MSKEDLKILLTIGLIVIYFVNLTFMFLANPINILIANIICWLIIIALFIGLNFIDWLND